MDTQGEQKPINILTRPPHFFFQGACVYALKWIAKKVMRKTRGPDTVLASLRRGLKEHGIPFTINKPIQPGQIVHVLSNVKALRYAISYKQLHSTAEPITLIAGPNIVVHPKDNNEIILSPEIDIVLVVSAWVQNLYNAYHADEKQRIHIWPAGVAIPKDISIANTDKKSANPKRILVFKKNIPQDIFESIITVLSENQSLVYEVIEYGTFSQKTYFKKLKNADLMIYLQESESQGLALQEAWILNVPTLVWNKGFYTDKYDLKILGNVSAPFMTPETGRLFDIDNFRDVLEQSLFEYKSFDAQDYSIKNLSDNATTNLYLNILRLNHDKINQ